MMKWGFINEDDGDGDDGDGERSWSRAWLEKQEARSGKWKAMLLY